MITLAVLWHTLGCLCRMQWRSAVRAAALVRTMTGPEPDAPTGRPPEASGPQTADERDRAYSEYLQQRKPLRRRIYRLLIYPRIARRLHGRVLDVGCGIGDFLAFRPGTIGVDTNRHNVRFCRHRGLTAFTVSDNRYPFADATFDGCLLDNVFEHIPEPAPLLRELQRILKPGGILVVGVPGERGYAHDPDHKRFYDEQSLVSTLGPHGFEPEHRFCTPLGRSRWLSRHLRQYCVYAVFRNGRGTHA